MDTKRQDNKNQGVSGRITLLAALVVYAVTLVIFSGATAYADTGFNLLAMVPLPTHAAGTAAVNEELNKFYSSGGGPAGTERVVVIDGMTFAKTIVGPGSDAQVDLKTDRYWSATVYSGGVVVRDGTTNNVVARIPLGGCPIDTTYDHRFNRMWAGAQCGGGNDPVFAIDANTFSVVAGPIGTGGVMGPIIANGANGRLYVLASGTSERVNPTTFALTTNAFGSVMAIDPRTNILYANNGSNLQIINGAPDPEVIMSTIPLSYTPASAGINQELNHLYLANAAGRSIEVRNGLTGSLTATFSLLATGAIPDGYMSIDSIRGRIYITATKGSGRVLLVIEDLTTARNARSNRG